LKWHAFPVRLPVCDGVGLVGALAVAVAVVEEEEEEVVMGMEEVVVPGEVLLPVGELRFS
jgi:hypothetical protein